MGNFVNRTTLADVRSQNDPDYSDPPWLFVPSGSGNETVINTVPVQYRKITGDVLSEMTLGEKDAVDAAETAAQIDDTTTTLKTDVDAPSPIGVDVRALIQTLNRRDNFNTNRIIELQNRVQAMLDSTGNVANMRADGLAVSVSATSTRSLPDAITDYQVDVDDPGVSG